MSRYREATPSTQAFFQRSEDRVAEMCRRIDEERQARIDEIERERRSFSYRRDRLRERLAFLIAPWLEERW